MKRKVCSHRGCFQAGSHGLGWGLSTGLVLWYCDDHFKAALCRLTSLIAAVQTTSQRAA